MDNQPIKTVSACTDKVVGQQYECEGNGCKEVYTAKTRWHRFHSRKCRDTEFMLKRYVSVTGDLTVEQIGQVRCKYGHPGVRQVK